MVKMNESQLELIVAMIDAHVEIANTEESCEACPIYNVQGRCDACTYIGGWEAPQGDAECQAEFIRLLGIEETHGKE